MKKIIQNAKKQFKVLVLHTDTEQGARFYSTFGFLKSSHYPNSTHYLELK
ncbi:hypothetical protein ACERII_05950 [Evansella sp. AB-rgal1]